LVGILKKKTRKKEIKTSLLRKDFSAVSHRTGSKRTKGGGEEEVGGSILN